MFQRFLFSWWIGNGDLHLKNLALLADRGPYRLSPAYDLLSTALVIPNDTLALPIGGKRQGLTARTWRAFGKYAGLRAPSISRSTRALVQSWSACEQLIANCFLPDDLKDTLSGLMESRLDVLKELATK